MTRLYLPVSDQCKFVGSHIIATSGDGLEMNIQMRKATCFNQYFSVNRCQQVDDVTVRTWCDLIIVIAAVKSKGNRQVSLI